MGECNLAVVNYLRLKKEHIERYGLTAFRVAELIERYNGAWMGTELVLEHLELAGVNLK